MTHAHTFVVILAGGGGTRLWPHSRKSRPKQFLPMLPGGETLLAATVRRTRSLAPIERTLVVTTAEQVEELRLCVPELPIDNILIEPLGRNTAPCIGLAAVAVRRRDPQGVMAVLPSDHFVADEASFMRTLTSALACAAAGHIVTLGIRPTHPETGYGYIQLGGSDTPDPASPAQDAQDAQGEPIWRAAAFVEKPTAARARDYLQAGNYVWNSGTFFFPAQRILAELHRHLPALGAILDDIAENPAHTAVRYPEAPSISIDYAVMERLGEEQVGPAAAIRVLSGDFGWNDVGSFAAVPLLHPADAQQNHIVRAARDPADPAAPKEQRQPPAAPEPMLVDSSGNLVWNSGHQLIAALGVTGLVIAVTGDVVLVMPRERAQDVRELVARLQNSGRGHHL
ncbi:MAG TPA: mannose-1-phosphate guanylyltransferase [Pseudomonadota bacterium]|nr:mannose-1-phosphate guanylyltransferase [Pseudomonadota bacterium]